MREWVRWVGTGVVLARIMILAPWGIGQDQQSQTADQQTVADTEQQAHPEEKEDQGRQRTYTTGTETVPSDAARSFGGSVFNDWQNHFGFSLGAYEIYANDSYPGQDLASTNAMITSFYPRLFANFGRRRSKLHLDAGFGYGFDNGDVSQDQQEYSANASYAYQATRTTALQISDSFLSSPDYYGSILNAIINPGPIYPPYYSSPYYRTGQRLLQNALLGNVSQRLGRKCSLEFYGSYNIYQYGTASAYNGDSASVGVGFGYHPKKWLSINTRYSRYLNQVNAQFSNATINDIEIGNFEFQLSRSWQLSASGGIQISDYYGRTYTMATARAKVSRNSRSNTLTISYYRGFSSATGLSQLYQSDRAMVDFGQRLVRRVSFLAGASYWNNNGINYAGGYEFWLARSGLEFLLLSSLVADVQYSYEYQKGKSPADSGIVNLNRNLVYFGLQYVWPGERRRR